MGPKGDTGAQGPQGETGPQGPQGIPGPPAPLSFVQLYDRNYTNEITRNGTPLNLSDIGINPLYTTGEYSLSTTTVKNDTLHLPGPGIYHIDVSLDASFFFALPAPVFGSSYQILFNVLNETDFVVTSLLYEGLVPSDADTALAETLLSRSLIYNTQAVNPTLKIILSNFNYSFAFEQKLGVSNLILMVQKWETP